MEEQVVDQLLGRRCTLETCPPTSAKMRPSLVLIQSQNNHKTINMCSTALLTNYYHVHPCTSMYCIFDDVCMSRRGLLTTRWPLVGLSCGVCGGTSASFYDLWAKTSALFWTPRSPQIQTIYLTVSKGCGRHPYNDRKAPRKGSEDCKQVMWSILDFLIFLAFLSMPRWSLTYFIRRSKNGQASAFIKYFGAGEASDFGIGNQRASEGAEQHCMKLVKLLPVSRLLTR